MESSSLDRQLRLTRPFRSSFGKKPVAEPRLSTNTLLKAANWGNEFPTDKRRVRNNFLGKLTFYLPDRFAWMNRTAALRAMRGGR
jgi:hypothetical protein